jgi:glycosyltransferase 2 family protein
MRTRVEVRKLRFSSILGQAGQQRRLVLFCLRLFLGLATLGLIASRVDLGGATLRANPHLLASVILATILLISSQAVAAYRWKLILAEDLLPWSYLLRLYIIGVFFGLFLPTSVGGDAVRAVAAARSSERPGGAIATVLIDRGFGVLATIAYALLGLAVAPQSLAVLSRSGMRWHAPGTTGTILVLGLIGLALLGLSRIARARAFWNEGMAALKRLLQAPARLMSVAVLAGLSQGLIILLWLTLAAGMNFGIPATTFLWAVPVVSLSALLPLTFAGLGVREGVWLVLLAGSSIASADILAFSLLYFACNVLVGLLGAFLFVSSGLAVTSADRARA